ncbi:MAG: M12 family metallo-peptidase, partial [Verrucomicrobiota bacterium]|nr:M12 family metallo-peptidase [Verrucomicrobiota bacterium]
MTRFILLALALLIGTDAFAQTGPWSPLDEKAMLTRSTAQAANAETRRNIVPQVYRALGLDRAALTSILRDAPPEFAKDATPAQLDLPLPGGGFGRFAVWESPVMAPELAAKYPEIKTYLAQGIDDPAAVARLDLTPRGFHAMVLAPNESIFIDPYWRDRDTEYVVYRKADYVAEKPFACLVDDAFAKRTPRSAAAEVARPSGATLRTYRLALACTGEYATAVCAPDPPNTLGALAAMVTSVNRVSGVYEREFAVRFSLIKNDDLLIYLDGSTDPYTNNDGFALLDENQQNIDNVIGDANYDFGHVFSTGGGGVAYLAVICAGGEKARGVTGSSNPKGDPYDIDYVAHEMGHQFGGDHTFNSTVSSCGGGNRAGADAYEPGSGTTIMAYAGICGATNLAPNSDDYFHTASYSEIDNFVSSQATCAITTATGNNPPVIAPPSAFTIPANTPFALTASATDADGDTLTYDWEEFDLGSSQSATNPISTSTNPLFRSFAPTQSPTRVFPSLTYIINNANTPPATVNGFATSEVLPTIARTMNFRVTVRDNHAGAGGSNFAATTVTTVNTGAAFLVTAPNTAATFAGGSQQTVSWNVAGTTGSGINCANVKITLSVDGGNTFPYVLAATAPNNGSASVTLPQIATAQGRIKVEAVGNIFFDISDANLTITSSNHAPTLSALSNITVTRGKTTPVVANVGTASDLDGDALSVAVVNVPFHAGVTPSIAGNNIILSASADCMLTTTHTTRNYPIT